MTREEATAAGGIEDTATIDFSMTWANALPLLLLVLENGTAEGRADARKELERMAYAADVGAAAQERERRFASGGMTLYFVEPGTEEDVS